MDLNQTKCGLLHLTRSREPTITQYTYALLDSLVNRSNSQRDLGMSITNEQAGEGYFVESQQDARSREANNTRDLYRSGRHITLLWFVVNWPTAVKC